MNTINKVWNSRHFSYLLHVVIIWNIGGIELSIFKLSFGHFERLLQSVDLLSLLLENFVFFVHLIGWLSRRKRRLRPHRLPGVVPRRHGQKLALHNSVTFRNRHSCHSGAERRLGIEEGSLRTWLHVINLITWTTNIQFYVIIKNLKKLIKLLYLLFKKLELEFFSAQKSEKKLPRNRGTWTT